MNPPHLRARGCGFRSRVLRGGSRAWPSAFPFADYCLVSSPAKAGDPAITCICWRPAIAIAPTAFTSCPACAGHDRERDKGPSLQDKAHRSERAELMRVDKHAALLDAEGISGALEDVAIRADVFPDAFVAPVAIADEVGRDRHQIVLARDDAHIRDQAPRA